MNRTWNLPGATRDLKIVAGPERRADPGRVPEVMLSSYLDRWLTAFPAVVYEIYDQLCGLRTSAPLSQYERNHLHQVIRARIAQAFRSEELIVLEIERKVFTAPPSRRPKPEEEEEPEELTYVAIELVDEDGQPVGGERYRLELPDGSVREGRLNSNGYARVSDIDPGQCTLTFPGLDASAWEPA